MQNELINGLSICFDTDTFRAQNVILVCVLQTCPEGNPALSALCQLVDLNDEQRFSPALIFRWGRSIYSNAPLLHGRRHCFVPPSRSQKR